jgi:lipopolysaccharide/colanic/teichoic acid biosynthesis glycosyltransferase
MSIPSRVARAPAAPSRAARHSGEPPRLRRPVRGKRALDVLVSGLLLIALAPVLSIIALAVRLDSPGPVIFRQRRLGRDLEPFAVLKFRTMHHDASSELHRSLIAKLAAEPAVAPSRSLKKLVADPRVTRVGAILRRFSLDELPQLVNVLRGEMSLVGPRPAIEYELDHYTARDFDRFVVRPGLTGLWQVSGRNRLGFREMLELDVRYARQSSLVLDLRIIARTPVAVLAGSA